MTLSDLYGEYALKKGRRVGGSEGLSRGAGVQECRSAGVQLLCVFLCDLCVSVVCL